MIVSTSPFIGDRLMTANIRIGSFNIGQGWDDYSKAVSPSSLNEAFQKELQRLGYDDKKKSADVATLDKICTEAKKNIHASAEGEAILKLTEELDIICLQEVLHGQRPFIDILNRQGFDYIVGPANPSTRLYSTAIAVRRGTFSHFQNISLAFRENDDRKIYGKQIAALQGTLKGREKTLTIASIHNWGLFLFDPGEKNRAYTQKDREDQKKHSQCLNQSVDHLDSYPSDITILMGDLNNNPENFPSPFQTMDEKGFMLKRVHRATHLNLSENYKEREIDFGFIKMRERGILETIAIFFVSLFCSTLHEKVETTELEIVPGFEFDMQKTCSDHLPVRFTIKIVNEEIPSKLTLLWRKIFA